jgi:hypothetical protein
MDPGVRCGKAGVKRRRQAADLRLGLYVFTASTQLT